MSGGSAYHRKSGVFKGKKRVEIKEYFSYALDFIKAHQNENTIISAVVHMDEKTPHMHLCFVPITENGKLSAKDIIGNKKKTDMVAGRVLETHDEEISCIGTR